MGDPIPNDAAAIVLAGGKSLRMGQPKALLPFHGAPLIAHVVGRLKALFGDIFVVAAPDQVLPKLEVVIVRDEVPHRGPVGGIYYGLSRAAPALSFVTSCDAPFVDLRLVSYLISQAPGHDVVVPFWQERFQPLHAVYRPTVLVFLKAQLERNELRPIFVYDKVRTRKVSEEEIRRFDPEGLSFMNMNTPADYEAALERWEALNPSPTEDGTCCTVELFGVARLVAKTSKLSLSLPPQATLGHVFTALADKLPALAGQVIEREGRSLTKGHACNINGRAFVRDPSVKIQPGDTIFIVSADAGG